MLWSNVKLSKVNWNQYPYWLCNLTINNFQWEIETKKTEMSHQKRNASELSLLSNKYKNKLNKIAIEMSKLIFFDTFRDLEKDWCSTDSKVRMAIDDLFKLKHKRISSLIGALFVDGLVLTPAEKETMEKYLFVQTEQERRSMCLRRCSRTFFNKMIGKHSGGLHRPRRNKRSCGENYGNGMQIKLRPS